MFEGFSERRVATSGAEIDLVAGGSGPPLLLLHGYPQTRAMWHRVAPRLAERFTVVCPDLRGYGRSSKPASDPEHAVYSKRATAQDLVEVMAALGHERFLLAGHDRGGRVAHRLALDHPERVERLAVLDIVPTHHVFTHVDKHLATVSYHWFFLIQPAPFPETLIGHDPAYWVRFHLRSWSGGRDDFFAPEALAEYEQAFADPATVHASCEDYRAGASIDLEHDEADLHVKISCPLLTLWGEWRLGREVAAPWRARAENVTARVLRCGHFVAEELPDETATALEEFFSG